MSVILNDYPFALCLTHDVDRIEKTYQSIYYTVVDRRPHHLLDLLPGRNPYWQFEEIMALEDEYGVRSAFYFLDEQYLFRDKPVRSWLHPKNWVLYTGRYSIDTPEVIEIIRELDAGGWEIGLHGSYESFNDHERLAQEKSNLESVLGHEVIGGRQHYLNLDPLKTWQYQAAEGLVYDSTLGSTTEFGFRGLHHPFRPFETDFVVFPLTIMELALPGVTSDPDFAKSECERLLQEAREHRAVMTILWHPNYFADDDYPNYTDVYQFLIERALELGAWVGPPGELYNNLEFSHESSVLGETPAWLELPAQSRVNTGIS